MSGEKGKSLSKLLNGIRGGFSQMSVMLEPIHFRNACLVYTIQFCILFGFVELFFSDEESDTHQIVMISSLFRLNTFRLWIVQLFAIIDEFEREFTLEGDSVDANLCTMIDFKVNKTLHIVNVPENADIMCEPVRVPLERWCIDIE